MLHEVFAYINCVWHCFTP